MRSTIRKALGAVALLLVALVAVLVFNTWRAGSVADKQPTAASATFDVKAAATRLGKAIRLRTVSKSPGVPVKPQAFLDLHAFLARSYPNAHKALTREVVGGYSLLYRWAGSDTAQKPILLMGHLDVVPAQGKWEHPPFSGAIVDGFIWGRGALDDKVSVLAIFEAVEHLIARGFRPRRTIYLAFGHDEEIDGRNGAARIVALLRKRGIRLAFVLDEGSPIGHGLVPGIEKPIALIGTAEKGYLSLKLTARSTGGHSSIPSRASAIRVLGDAFKRLEAKPPPARIAPPASQTLDFLAPELSFLPRLIISNRWLFDPLLLSGLKKIPEAKAMITTTAAATIIKAGFKDNVLPAEARVVVNFRILPGDTVARITTHVRQTIDDPAITVEQLGDANEPSPVADPESESYRKLVLTVRQVFPDVVVAPALVIAATDSRHYTQVADQVFRFLPTRLGPKDLPRIHGIDERIAIQNYGEIIQFFIQLIRNTAG